MIGTNFGFSPHGKDYVYKSPLQKELDKNDCVFDSAVETGKQIYCGKACWRKEIRTEYICKTGIKVVIE